MRRSIKRTHCTPTFLMMQQHLIMLQQTFLTLLSLSVLGLIGPRHWLSLPAITSRTLWMVPCSIVISLHPPPPPFGSIPTPFSRKVTESNTLFSSIRTKWKNAQSEYMYMYSLSHSQLHFLKLFAKLKAKARRSLSPRFSEKRPMSFGL